MDSRQTNVGGAPLTGPVRVLHVDDDPTQLDLTADLLEAEFDALVVDSETDPQAAYEQARDCGYDCIVSDYDMPGTDGLALLEQLRADGCACPFILFTGKGSEEVASKAISAGVTDYLQKEGGTDLYTLLGNRVLNAVERTRTETALAESERMYDDFVESTPTPVFLYDADGTLQMANDAFAALLGRDRETIIGTPLSEHIHPDDVATIETRVDRISAGEELSNAELRFETGDGDHRTAVAACAPITHRESVAGYTVLHDITDRVERERDLERFKQHIESALTRAEAAIWVYDITSGEVQRFGVEQLLGFEQGTLTGNLEVFYDNVHPEDRERVREAYRTALRDGESFDIDFRVGATTGESRWLRDRSEVITDENGDPVRVIGIMIDATERKQHREQLRRQTEHLESLGSVMSHDLQTPLRVLETRLDLARETGDTSQLDEAGDALDRVSQLLGDVTTTLTSGTVIDEYDEVDLAAVARTGWETSAVNEATLEIVDDRTLAADEQALTRLFENLFRNAVEHGSAAAGDAGGDGSAVTVRVGTTESGFYVADDGQGLPPSREDLFEFGATTKNGGSGIGLASVQQVVRAHGWTVEATDSREGGARFEFDGVDRRSGHETGRSPTAVD